MYVLSYVSACCVLCFIGLEKSPICVSSYELNWKVVHDVGIS